MPKLYTLQYINMYAA